MVFMDLRLKTTFLRFLWTLGTVLLPLLLLHSPTGRTEEYRHLAHQLGDLSKTFKRGVNLAAKATNTGVAVATGVGVATIPVLIPSLVILNVTLAPLGIGLITTGATIAVLGGAKLYKFVKAKPYYRMARIMEYAKESSKRKKDEQEFFRFYFSINPQKKSSPQQVMALLRDYSRQGRLEGYPLEDEVRRMIEEGWGKASASANDSGICTGERILSHSNLARKVDDLYQIHGQLVRGQLDKTEKDKIFRSP